MIWFTFSSNFFFHRIIIWSRPTSNFSSIIVQNLHIIILHL